MTLQAANRSESTCSFSIKSDCASRQWETENVSTNFVGLIIEERVRVLIPSD